MEYRGSVASPGIAIGKAFVFTSYAPLVSRRILLPAEVEEELSVLDAACFRAREELTAIISRLKSSDPEKADIFSAHLAILQDEELLGEIREAVRGKMHTVSWAIRQTYDEFSALLREAEDAHLRERVSDMDDVCARLLRCAEGVPETTLADLHEPSIVVAVELFPSDTVLMDPSKILGIITEHGGVTSHTAIIAKSYGIPALLGVKAATRLLPTGTDLVLDALTGKVLTGASEETLKSYEVLRDRESLRRTDAAAYLFRPAVTKDGTRIDVEANIGSASPSALEVSNYTDGVGLFRTEFLYMEGNQLPDEETQYSAYRAALEVYGNRPVVLRTLDIGGDKTLSYMELPHEDNPFLGKRALRLCLDEPEIFKSQLRAALRASVHGNLWMMFPMVGSLDDLRAAKKAVAETKAELDREGVAYRPDFKLGVMIEIPSAALTADLIAREVDFASIGTNDLIQYLTAADRLNSEVSPYYQSFHPAVFRTIKTVADAFRANGKDLCVCGELGGNPSAAVAFIGMGLRRLSMSSANVAGIKQVIANITVAEAEEVAGSILSMSTAAEIEAELNQFTSKKIGGDSGN